MKIKKITNYTESKQTYDLTVDEYSCYVANGVLVHNTDGVNLMFSYRDDRGVIGARNKGDVKNFGENALSPKSIREKFKGRPLEIAYGNAMDDLQKGIEQLSKKQRDKIFDNGRKWMSVEVMAIDTAENVIKYGVNELRLHGTIEHDEDGNKLGGIDKESAIMLDGMLRQRKSNKGNYFEIKKLNQPKLPEVQTFEKTYNKYVKELTKYMKSNGMSDSNSISDSIESQWLNTLKGKTNDQGLIDLLIQRWANYDKSYSIAKIYKQYPDDKDWIKKMDKESGKMNKSFKLPLEKLFLGFGSEILKGMTDFMALNPDETTQDLAKKLEDAIELIKDKGNEKQLDKLTMELDRLNATHGVIPTEGITFIWNGNFLKLTGSFASINQIIGMTYQIR